MAERTLVLSKKQFSARPYDRWLAPRETVIFASDEDEFACAAAVAGGAGSAPVTLFEDWLRNPAVESAAREAHRERPFTGVVALAERDQLRAGRLRDAFGVPGLTEEASRAFRDKVLMKSIAHRAGLTVPRYALLDRTAPCRRFLEALNRPVVVKPRDGAGSAGVEVFREPSALWDWAEQRAAAQYPIHYIAEEYVDAPMVSVDGLTVAGRLYDAMVGIYTSSCHEALSTLAPHGLLQLDDRDERATRARGYVERLLRALPETAGTRSFHCELFDHPTRGMMLCEIAGRTGGGQINEMAKRRLGIDMDQFAAMGQAGLRPERVLPRSARSPAVFGDAVFLRPGRTLRRAPKSCDIPGVVRYLVRATPGQYVPRARKMSESAIEVLFAAPRHSALTDLYRRIVQWIDEYVAWE